MGTDFFDLASRIVATLYSIRSMASDRPREAQSKADEAAVLLERGDYASAITAVINQLGRVPMLGGSGQVIQPSLGLLAEADQAFRKLEPRLQPVHLVTQAFEVEGFTPQRYAWPVLQTITNQAIGWACELCDIWAGKYWATPEDKKHLLSAEEKRLRETSADEPGVEIIFIEEKQLWREAIDRCPLSDELLEAISWRLVQERDWLGQQQSEQPAAKAKAGGGRGGNNRNTDDRETVAKRLAEWHGYDANGDKLEDRITKLTPIKGGALAKLAGVSGGLVSEWMAGNFGSQRKYNQLCVRGNDTDKKKLDQIFASVMPRPKRSRTATAGELAFQTRTVAEGQHTDDEIFELARADADKRGEIISDDEIWRRVRALRVS